MTLAAEAAPGVRHLVAAGGVAANGALRSGLDDLARQAGWELHVPPLRYCTDNAAMIALAGVRRYQALGAAAVDKELALAPRARWPLDEAAQGATLGSGRKGRKA